MENNESSIAPNYLMKWNQLTNDITYILNKNMVKVGQIGIKNAWVMVSQSPSKFRVLRMSHSESLILVTHSRHLSSDDQHFLLIQGDQL